MNVILKLSRYPENPTTDLITNINILLILYGIYSTKPKTIKK
jgi:hypothetical protein